jgi:hypothetical protein
MKTINSTFMNTNTLTVAKENTRNTVADVANTDTVSTNGNRPTRHTITTTGITTMNTRVRVVAGTASDMGTTTKDILTNTEKNLQLVV